MDIEQYFNVQQYLLYNKYPSHIQHNRDKKKFVNMAKFFTIQNSKLYRYDKRRPEHLLQVLK